MPDGMTVSMDRLFLVMCYQDYITSELIIANTGCVVVQQKNDSITLF